MTNTPQFEPIIGWGNRRKDDTECGVTFIKECQYVRFQPTPTLGCNKWDNYFWWDNDLARVGISSGGNSAVWNSANAVGYVIDIWYPTEFSGSCNFGILPEPLKSYPGENGKVWYSRPDKYLFLRMPYSSASLEKLLRISSVMSQLGLGPIKTFQSSDSRF